MQGHIPARRYPERWVPADQSQHNPESGRQSVRQHLSNMPDRQGSWSTIHHAGWYQQERAFHGHWALHSPMRFHGRHRQDHKSRIHLSQNSSDKHPSDKYAVLHVDPGNGAQHVQRSRNPAKIHPSSHSEVRCVSFLHIKNPLSYVPHQNRQFGNRVPDWFCESPSALPADKSK